MILVVSYNLKILCDIPKPNFYLLSKYIRP